MNNFRFSKIDAKALALAVILLSGIGSGLAAAQDVWRQVVVTSIQGPQGQVAGRVNAAVPDPTDANVMYIATDGARPTGVNGGNPLGPVVVGLPDTGGGGVWKTVDWLSENPHWTPLTDAMPSLSVGQHGLAMAPSNPQVLYAAADGPQGAILKTVDGGLNWTALAQEKFAGVKFGGIAVSPVNPDLVYVAVFRPDAVTSGGVYKSYDGGSSWYLAGNMRGNVAHVVVDPNDESVLYAGFVDAGNPTQQGVWKSEDYGNSWQQLNANFPAGSFDSVLYIGFAIAPSATQEVFAVVLQPADKPVQRVYSTLDGGTQWTHLCPTNADPDNRYWHQPLAVHPFNPRLVYAEGFNHDAVYSSTGGRERIDSDGKPTCQGVWTVFWTDDDPAGYAFYLDPDSPDGLAFAAFGDRGIYRVVNTMAPEQNSDFSHKQGDLANILLSSLAVHPADPGVLRGIGFDQIHGLAASAADSAFWSPMPIGSEFGKTLFNPTNPAIEYNLTSVGEGATFDTAIQRFENGVWSPIGAHGFKPSDFPYARAVQTDAAAWKALEFDPSTQEGLLYGGVRVFAWTPGTPFTPIVPNSLQSLRSPNRRRHSSPRSPSRKLIPIACTSGRRRARSS